MTRPHAVRVARHTARLGELVAFYRDGIGLSEIGGFRGHDGYDGVFLAVPGTGVHLELTTGGEHGAPSPHPESLLVLYLGDAAAASAPPPPGVPAAVLPGGGGGVPPRPRAPGHRSCEPRQPVLGRARADVRGS